MNVIAGINDRFSIGAVVLALLAMPLTAHADSIPSAKLAFRTGDVKLVNAKNVAYSTVAKTLIKGSSPADLIIDVSLVCGLMTSTTVRSKDGAADAATASAAVYARILVDGKQANPGEIPMCKRTQTLSATLQGIIGECKDANGDGTLDMATECTTTPEGISLVLDTAAAHSFAWGVENIGSGVHSVELQIRVDSNGSAQAGAFNGFASVGAASIRVQKANLKGNELLF